MEVVGQVFEGEEGKIIIRQKSDSKIEIGDLLVAEEEGSYIILKVFNLLYGSQIESKQLQLMSGMKLEGYESDVSFMEENLRSYLLAQVKGVVEVSGKKVKIPKTLPRFFSKIRRVVKEDLWFLEKPENPIYIGKIRSGSKVIDVDVFLDGEKAFSHHVLIPATTGRGKSNLVKVMLWSIANKRYCGMLVLDPHDEYFGRNGIGLKEHPDARDNVFYYSSNPTKGSFSLMVNLSLIKPWHFHGIMSFTDAQNDLIYNFYSKVKKNWISEILTADTVPAGSSPTTLEVVKRKLKRVLSLSVDENNRIYSVSKVFVNGVLGESVVKDIVSLLEQGKKVIIDTSMLSNQAELLVGSIIANEIFDKYKEAKMSGELEQKPVISIVIEEAPRVLGANVVNSGDNIYGTIAREGRKFKIGLCAITQLTSEIPREILANMNTKIILGNEMKAERFAIIESASQDLSDDAKTIAALDKGEAIISSSFVPFAIPVLIPNFLDTVKLEKPLQKNLAVFG